MTRAKLLTGAAVLVDASFGAAGAAGGGDAALIAPTSTKPKTATAPPLPS